MKLENTSKQKKRYVGKQFNLGRIERNRKLFYRRVRGITKQGELRGVCSEALPEAVGVRRGDWTKNSKDITQGVGSVRFHSQHKPVQCVATSHRSYLYQTRSRGDRSNHAFLVGILRESDKSKWHALVVNATGKAYKTCLGCNSA
jgi:hypothetical protein